jgi:hypothetical protein
VSAADFIAGVFVAHAVEGAAQGLGAAEKDANPSPGNNIHIIRFDMIIII